jgi:5-methylcytosine-specific restriction endonuclease McrA
VNALNYQIELLNYCNMKKKAKKPKYNQNAQIRSAIRRAFSRSPVVQEVLKEARIEEPKYNKDGSLAKKPAVFFRCAICGRKFKRTEIAADHINPVIEVDKGFMGWDVFVDRLGWERKENLQALCNYKLKYKEKYDNINSCHYQKTQIEKEQRKLQED